MHRSSFQLLPRPVLYFLTRRFSKVLVFNYEQELVFPETNKSGFLSHSCESHEWFPGIFDGVRTRFRMLVSKKKPEGYD